MHRLNAGIDGMVLLRGSGWLLRGQLGTLSIGARGSGKALCHSSVIEAVWRASRLSVLPKCMLLTLVSVRRKFDSPDQFCLLSSCVPAHWPPMGSCHMDVEQTAEITEQDASCSISLAEDCFAVSYELCVLKR